MGSDANNSAFIPSATSNALSDSLGARPFENKTEGIDNVSINIRLLKVRKVFIVNKCIFYD